MFKFMLGFIRLLFALFLWGLVIRVFQAAPLVLVGLFVLWLIYLFSTRHERRAKRQVLNRQKEAKENEERAEREAQARAKMAHRDADRQSEPYEYECIGHPNVTLALRYGIANQKKTVKEYWYFGRGGVKQRNPDRDTVSYSPASTIRLLKIRKLEDSHYIAELPDYANRRVKVVIKPGQDFIKTFLPIEESWFRQHDDLERVLKDNKTFTLKELAMLHVQKTVRGV